MASRHDRPAFQAVADLGTSVSELNAATHDLTGKVKKTASSRGASVASAVTAVNDSVKHVSLKHHQVNNWRVNACLKFKGF